MMNGSCFQGPLNTSFISTNPKYGSTREINFLSFGLVEAKKYHTYVPWNRSKL